MASHPISHENLEPGSTCSPADVDIIAALKISTISQAHEVSSSASPQRIPFQPVPSNLGVVISGSPIQAGGVAISLLMLHEEAERSGPTGVILGKSAGKDSSILPETWAAESPPDSVGQLSSSENEVQSSSLMNTAATGPPDKQSGSGSVNEVSGEGLGRAQRILLTPHEVQGQEADSEVQGRALGAGARRVEIGTGEGSTEEHVKSNDSLKKEPPLAWFPRAKKDSFLERKIKKMQESEGPKEHLGEAFVKKMSRVEREKAAAAAAAEAALAAKKAALVEVSWCRILEAAGIPCDDAVVRARAAESEASKAATAAASLGVVLSPNGPKRTSPGGGRAPRGYRDVIFASTQSEADVEKEVVGAVKAALRQAKLTSAGEAITSASEGGFGEGVGKGEWERMGEGKLKTEAQDDAVQPVSPPSLVSTPPPLNGGSAKSPSAFLETPSPQKKPRSSAKSPTVKSPGSLFGGEGSPYSPTRIKTPAGSPGGSRLGGLLMACISPQRGARAQGGEEDIAEEDVGGSREKCAKPEIIKQTTEERPKLCQGEQDECAKSEAGTPGKQQQSEQGQRGENVDVGGQRSGVSTPVSGVKSGGRLDKDSCAESEVKPPEKKQDSEQRELGEHAPSWGQRSVISSPVSGAKSCGRSSRAADRYSRAAESPEEKHGEVGENVRSAGEKSDGFPPGSGVKSGGRAAQRYSHATDSSELDDEGGQVTSAFRGFSPVKSPSRAPAYALPNTGGVPGMKEPGVGELSPQPAATPGGNVTKDLAGDGGEGTLVGEMVNRLVGLSEEQRNAVSSVVAARGFGGFLENSPFASRPASEAQPEKPPGFGDDFIIKRSKLEIAKAAAAAAAKATTDAPLKNAPRAQNPTEFEQGLDQIMVKKMSKLEIAKAEAIAASKAEAEGGGAKNGVNRGKSGQDALAELGLDQVLVKRMSKLEKAKADAVAAAKADPSQDGRVVKGQVNKTQPGAVSHFGQDLVKHISKMEKAKADAVAAAQADPAQGGRAPQGRVKVTQSGAVSDFGQDLVKHMSKLEKAKAEATAAAKLDPGSDSTTRKPLRTTVATHSHTGGLKEMVKKMSRLEQEKEASRKAAESEDALTPTTVLSGGFKEGGVAGVEGEGFGQGFVKKLSKLEHEKLVAQEKGFGVSAPVRGGRPKQDASAWEGQGLGTLKKHVSRLEREKLAWKEAEEAAQVRR